MFSGPSPWRVTGRRPTTCSSCGSCGPAREPRELGRDAPLGMYAAVLALERTLYLTPRERRERLQVGGRRSAAGAGEWCAADVELDGLAAQGGAAKERERLLRG